MVFINDMVNTECPNCGKIFEVPESHVGQYGRCGSCNEKFLIESVAVASTPREVAAQDVKPAPAVASANKKRGVGLAVAATLLLAAGGGAWWMNEQGMFSKNDTVSKDDTTSKKDTDTVTDVDSEDVKELDVEGSGDSDDVSVFVESSSPSEVANAREVNQVLKSKKKQFKDLAAMDSYSGEKNGFLIVTTNDLTHRLKQLQNFISHKAGARGYRMFIATEDDFGPGIGLQKAFHIREWIRQNYEDLGIKYAMFIGVGHPEEGDIPMVKASDRWPTDYFYTDLTGDWDLDKDGVVASQGDYGEGGIDGVPEVYVGRIPYYGENSDWGKAEDTDVILARSIRYDNEKQISWRYGFTQLQQWDMIPNEVYFERDVLEPLGIDYFRDKCYQDTIGFPHFELHAAGMQHNVAKLHKMNLGYTRLGGHGAPTGMHGINTWQTRQFLNDKQPTVVNMGACDVGKIEHQHNLAYALLRFHAIATHGGTRSVSGYRGNPSKTYRDRLLEDKNTVGQAWWEHYGDTFTGRNNIGGTAYLINVFGDPTIQPFPTGLHLPYSFITKPVKPYHRVADSLAGIKNLPSHTLSLNNHNDTTQKVAVSTTEDWLVANQQTITLEPGDTKTVKFEIDSSKTTKLTPGVHQAEILLDDGKGYVCKRLFYLEVADARMQAHFDFEVNHGKNGGAKYIDRLGSHYEIARNKRAKKGGEPTKGKYGKGINMTDGGLDMTLKSPNQGHFTYAFWVKRDDINKKAHLLKMHLFLDVIADANSIDVRLQEFDCWGKDKDIATKVNKTFDINWKSGKWTHLAFSFNQDTGVLDVFQDMKKIGSLPAKPYMTFAPRGQALGHFAGAIDEFSYYNKTLTPSELQQVYANTFIDKPSPSNLAQRVVPGKVELKFTTGQSVKPKRIHIREKGTEKATYVSADVDGKWFAKNVKPNTTYQWLAQYRENGKTKQSPVWEFTTSKNLIANGNFESEGQPWQGGGAHIIDKPNQVLADKRSLYVPHGKTIHAKASDPIKEGQGYALNLTVRTAWKKLVHYELYTVIDGKEVSLKKVSRDMYQDRYGKRVEIDFYANKGEDYIGKPLFVRITNDPEQGSHSWIDDITLMPYSHKSTNSAPEAIKNLDEFRPEWDMFNNSLVVRLQDLFADPEGQTLEFRKIEGPEWLRVRNGEIMSNFGAGKDDLGENKITIEVKDSHGAKIQASVVINVVEAKEAVVGTKRTIFLDKFKLHGSGLTKNADHVSNWKNTGDYVEIASPELTEGTYHVLLNYACTDQHKGSSMVLEQGGNSIEFQTSGRRNWNPEERIIGNIYLKDQPLRLKAKSINGQAMNLYSVSFVKVKDDMMTITATEGKCSGGAAKHIGSLIGHITDDTSVVDWTFTPKKTAKYKVNVYAGSVQDNVAKLTVNGKALQFNLNKTGGYKVIKDHKVGVVELKAGQPVKVKLSSVKREEGLCDLSHINFEIVENQAPKFEDRPLRLASFTNPTESKSVNLKDLVKDENPAKLEFELIKAPSWVSCDEAGKVSINNQKTRLNSGMYHCIFKVTDHKGMSDTLYTWIDTSALGVFRLKATDAQLSPGKGIRFTGNRITHIIRDDATATWTFTPEESGSYEVKLIAGSPRNNTGKMIINGKTTEFSISKTGNKYDQDESHHIGEFSFEAGKATTLTLGVVDRGGDGLCDISGLEITKKD